jgi:D-serine deaminase-like pyridoxal phosphate-dependent protein
MSMGSLVSGDAQLVKEVAGFARQRVVDLQALQEIGEGLVRCREQADTRGKLLCKPLRELAQLDEAGVGIWLKVALRQRAEPDQLRVVLTQELKVDAPDRYL